VLVNAMGAGEYYGSNSNGDHFPEAGLIHRPSPGRQGSGQDLGLRIPDVLLCASIRASSEQRSSSCLWRSGARGVA
jgi:hypothetical protein